MKLKTQQVMDATLVISQIIREKRPMPQTGKYRLARMHAKLAPEFGTINAQRDELITAYDHHEMVMNGDGEMHPAAEFSVPVDKMPEFTKAWKEIADQEIDIDVEPIPLACLDLGGMTDGAIDAHELIILGGLVRAE